MRDPDRDQDRARDRHARNLASGPAIFAGERGEAVENGKAERPDDQARSRGQQGHRRSRADHCPVTMGKPWTSTSTSTPAAAAYAKRVQMPRYRIHLACELGNPEAVDHVGAADLDIDRPTRGNVQLGRGMERSAVWSELTEFPPPLMAARVNRHHIRRRMGKQAFTDIECKAGQHRQRHQRKDDAAADDPDIARHLHVRRPPAPSIGEHCGHEQRDEGRADQQRPPEIADQSRGRPGRIERRQRPRTAAHRKSRSRDEPALRTTRLIGRTW